MGLLFNFCVKVFRGAAEAGGLEKVDESIFNFTGETFSRFRLLFLDAVGWGDVDSV